MSSFVSRPLLVRSVSILGGAIGFYLPLSVVPLFNERSAGSATVALLVATVAGELGTPRLVARAGYRWALTIGLTLLGLPTLLLLLGPDPALILAVSVVRGLGFAICTVAGGALTATLIPPDRRGEGLAFVGLVSGVSGLLALPAGVWAAQRWGFSPVFVVTTVATLLALVSVPALPTRAAVAPESAGILAGLRQPSLNRPAALFATSTAAVGVLVTYLPLAGAGRPGWTVALALLVQPAAATVTRWIAGRLGDRHGLRRLLAPGLVLSAAGMAALALTDSTAAVVGGALLFGAGFGVLQNTTLALMYAEAPAGCEDTVSAVWNIAYDLGMAAGAFVAGLTVTSIGYGGTFLLAGVAMLPALLLIPAPAVARGRRAVQPVTTA
ncbi:MFS transporter [Actinoplanes sp. NPDC051411]|uniref:MFS transporter n=1 Tax=Actinoplanes sp. NPDC051411 TaxID=3155522 RepID=UPI00342D17D0